MTADCTTIDVTAEALAKRETAARQHLRDWFDCNPSYTYQTFLDRVPEAVDKSTVTRWLSGRLSARTSKRAMLLLETAEELMVVPTGDVAAEGSWGREPRDDDERHLFALMNELQQLNRLCAEHPVRLVFLAGRHAVPARNMIDRDRTMGCGNVLAYMHEGLVYATVETISAAQLRLAVQRASMLREAAFAAMPAYEGRGRRWASAKLLNYDGSSRARAALLLDDRDVFESAMPDLVASVRHESRNKDGIWVNIVEVLDAALGVAWPTAPTWSRAVAEAAIERPDTKLRHALRLRKVPHVRNHWAVIAPELLPEPKEKHTCLEGS
jgi:hypothetical protein